MGIDKRLSEYWRRRQSARKGEARPPAGPRPALRRLDEPTGEPAREARRPAEGGSNVVPLELEDR